MRLPGLRTLQVQLPLLTNVAYAEEVGEFIQTRYQLRLRIFDQIGQMQLEETAQGAGTLSSANERPRPLPQSMSQNTNYLKLKCRFPAR